MAMIASNDAAARDLFERHEALSASSGTLRLASTVASTIEVTTLDDVVDATDGVLSLHEAITLANDTAGADTITFADSLRGGTILLKNDLPDITDALTIDGDPDDGGPGGIVIDGSDTDRPGRQDGNIPDTLLVRDTTLGIEDITLDSAGWNLIRAHNSDIEASRMLIQYAGLNAYWDSAAIRLDGGSLSLDSSTVRRAGIAIRFNDASVDIARSTIADTGGEYLAGVFGSGTVNIVESYFRYNGSRYAGAINVVGSVDISGSTFVDNDVSYGSRDYASGPIRVSGELRVENSTIADSRLDYASGLDRGDLMGAIALPSGSTAEIVNTTITGTVDLEGAGPVAGLVVGAGGEATIINSIVDDTVLLESSTRGQGLLISNGANTFRDIAVDGAVAGDRLGVTADQLFALTEEIGDSGLLKGVPDDNGGATQTVALLNRADNPALNAADPADAPPTDQRGNARDATPDIGAFESAVAPQPVLEVTTLDDVVDATDGELSLREAVTLANDQAGADIITFADAIRGGTIRLELAETPSGAPGGLGDLVITDDVVIDGDLADDGSGGITIHGARDPGAYDFVGARDVIRVVGAQARLEDLTLAGGDTGLRGDNADVQLRDATMRDNREGIDFEGGTLSIADSGIVNNSVPLAGGEEGSGIRFSGDRLTIERSLIEGNSGSELGDGRGVTATGEVIITDSLIHDNHTSFAGYGLVVSGDLRLEGSTIMENGASIGGGAGVWIDGDFEITNSTIANNFHGYSGYAYGPVGGLVLADGSHGMVVNTTISGTIDVSDANGHDVSDSFTRPSETGVYMGEGATLFVQNSIIHDSIGGGRRIDSNGANTFRTFVEGASDGIPNGDGWNDTADQLFALTEEIGDSGVLRGVPGDNGGATPTIALLDSAGNPAIDAADPSDAPPLDQRGIARNSTPDRGAFEFGDLPRPPAPPPEPMPDTLPDLVEGSPLAGSLINGVDPAMLTIGDTGDATITFIGENGAFASSLGAYLIDGDGRMVDVKILFGNMQADGSSPAIAPGDEVMLGDIFDPVDLAEGVQFGLFLVGDGANGNLPDLLGSGQLAFLDGADTATTSDVLPRFVHLDENGQETTVEGNVMHAFDADPSNTYFNDLNPIGRGHAVSGWLDGQFVVGFEDKPWPSNDIQEPDFNDVLIAISPAGTDGTNGSASALSAGIVDETGPAQAELDAALGSLSSSAVANGPGIDAPAGGMSVVAGGAADTGMLVLEGELAATA